MRDVKKEVVLIGAGKIGRGYIASVFQKAGYHITFLTRSLEQAQQLRERGSYTVFRESRTDGSRDEYTISNYEAYSTVAEQEECVRALARTNYAVVHLYPNATEAVATLIGRAIAQRVKSGDDRTLDVIFKVNFARPAKKYRQAILECLTTQEERTFLEEKVGLVEALTYGGGYPPQPYMLEQDPLAVSTTDEEYLRVDRDAFKGPYPPDVPVLLFDRMEGRLIHKVWSGNMQHCAMAMYSRHFGYNYMWQGARDPYIISCIERARQEANDGIFSKHNLTQEDVDDKRGWEGQEYYRQAQTEDYKDKISRVAADPIRKLSKDDRLIGPALLCLECGKVPYFLARAAAVALLYWEESDPASMELARSLAEHGIYKTIEHFCGLSDEVQDERVLKQLIAAHYHELLKSDPFEMEKK